MFPRGFTPIGFRSSLCPLHEELSVYWLSSIVSQTRCLCLSLGYAGARPALNALPCWPGGLKVIAKKVTSPARLPNLADGLLWTIWTLSCPWLTAIFTPLLPRDVALNGRACLTCSRWLRIRSAPSNAHSPISSLYSMSAEAGVSCAVSGSPLSTTSINRRVLEAGGLLW